MRETPYPEARAAAEAACGQPLTLTLISNRRGSAVWKATGPRGSVAVKAGTGEGAAITTREAAVLQAMGAHGGRAAQVRGDGLAWMVTPWFTGPSTWDALHTVRKGTANPAAALPYLVELCEAVARLHSNGWVHADLQPHHAIHTAQGVRLIDCSWAWRPGFAPSHLFRGGLVHLLSPELAGSVEAGHSPVAPTPADEVYTLAAGLWWAMTGAWPLDYKAAGVDPGKLTAAVLRRVIASQRVPLRAPTAWPAVQEVLAAVLSEQPERRPSAADLAHLLRSTSATDAARV